MGRAGGEGWTLIVAPAINAGVIGRGGASSALRRGTFASPKLTVRGRLDPAKATEGEIAGEKLFFGKAQCSTCHPAPFYLDNQMHDLHVERFLKNEAGDGPIKAFTLRGIKDSPPYLHDGRLLTLEDTVEFFNLVLELKLTPKEKTDLVDFMRQL